MEVPELSKVKKGRFTADLPPNGDIVLFLIGMRINKLWQVWRWFPVFVAMPKMIFELAKKPELGLINRPKTFVSGRVIMVVQFWQSFSHLETYARNPELTHLPAWRAFNRRIKDNGSVGIWHETYQVPAGNIDSIYGNMPEFGLGAAYRTKPPGSAANTAAQRIGDRPEDTPPVESY